MYEKRAPISLRRLNPLHSSFRIGRQAMNCGQQRTPVGSSRLDLEGSITACEGNPRFAKGSMQARPQTGFTGRSRRGNRGKARLLDLASDYASTFWLWPRLLGRTR